MAAFVHERVGLRATGTATNIPNNPRARLMYYLSCVSSVLQLDNPNVNRLKNYSRYFALDEEDETLLLYLVILLSPDELIGKVFFPSDELCGNSNNEFFEISRVSHLFAVQQNIVIGGERKRVVKIMTFKQSWMHQNYINPMRAIQQQRARREEARRAASNACTIL